MPIITLTTDYGNKDYFAAALKGNILKQNSTVHLVDVTHQIKPFQIGEAAYILTNAYKHFPKGSIHIVDIDSEKTKEKNHVAIEYDGHYFIGADNGIFSLMFYGLELENIYQLSIDRSIDHNIIFPAKDIFVTAACHLSKGGTLPVIGRKTDHLKAQTPLRPSLTDDGNMITASVIYIDQMGNVVLNITKQDFQIASKGRSFSITAFKKGARISGMAYKGRSINNNIEKIHDTYTSVGEGNIVAIFNSAQHLEIAINRYDSNINGGAALILGLKYADTIHIQFHDN